MRSRITALLATPLLLISIGLAALLSPTTAYAAGGIVVPCSAIEQSAATLSSHRTYLSNNRTASAWSARVPRVNQELQAVTAYFQGDAQVQLRTLSNRFASQAGSLQYSGALTTLGTTIGYLRNAC